MYKNNSWVSPRCYTGDPIWLSWGNPTESHVEEFLRVFNSKRFNWSHYFVWFTACIYLIAHNRAIRPCKIVIICHSHWSSQRGINDSCYENLWSDAAKGTHPLSTLDLLFQPWASCGSLSSFLLFSRSSMSTSTEPTLSCRHFFPSHPNLPRFPHHVYHSSGVTCATSPLLRLSRSCPLPPVPGLWFSAWWDGLAGVSGLAGVIAGYSLASPPLSRLPSHLYYHFVTPQALSPLHPYFYSPPRSRSHSRSRSRLQPYPRARSRTHPLSCPRPRLCPRHHFPPPVPGTLLSPRYHIVGQAPSLTPEAAGYLQAPPPVYIDNDACGMAVPGPLLCFFSDVVGTKSLLLPPFPAHYYSLSRLRSRPCSRLRSRLRLCRVLRQTAGYLQAPPPVYGDDATSCLRRWRCAWSGSAWSSTLLLSVCECECVLTKLHITA